jgi:hypothetical protein
MRHEHNRSHKHPRCINLLSWSYSALCLSTRLKSRHCREETTLRATTDMSALTSPERTHDQTEMDSDSNNICCELSRCTAYHAESSRSQSWRGSNYIITSTQPWRELHVSASDQIASRRPGAGLQAVSNSNIQDTEAMRQSSERKQCINGSGERI